MTESGFRTPILLVVFNRPNYTKLVFEEIRKVRPTRLFIAADGPRENRPDDSIKCEEVRKIVSKVDWPCEVKTLFREKNFGFRDAERFAFDWFFENVEEGIILEDDQLPHKDFFRFCEEMLEKYRNNEQIMMITGGNFLPNFKSKNSYFFSNFFSIWGWAAWRRSWKNYDFEIKGWGNPENKEKLKKMYHQKYMVKRLSKMFDEIYSGEKNTWDTQWAYACIVNNGLCVTPKVNLISNIGIDGVHQSGHNQNLLTHGIYEKSGLQHPKIISENADYDDMFYEANFKEPDMPITRKIKRKIISVFVKYESLKKVYRFLNQTSQSYKNKVTNKITGIAHIPAKGRKNGDVLLSYITEPFTKSPWKSFSNLHTNYWECYEIAHLFSERGYAVDIINWNNYKFIPRKKYKICIDIQNNLERLSKFLPKDCIKIMHIVTSHSDYQNSAEIKRLEKLKERRGIKFTPRRQMLPSKNLEYADYLEGFGNKTVHATYAKFNKPIFPIPISAVKLFDFPKNKDFEKSRTNFLWFGGGGAVLKGLDLVLESFSKNPNLTLHICGPVATEKDFVEVYKKELYETPNIHTHGRIDVASDLFGEIVNKCDALIYPAFSEGTSGAVVQAMHAGIIPIITPQSGIYEDAGAIIIKEPTVNSISEAINSFAKLAPETIKNMSRDIQTYARKYYTRESFSYAYSNFIDTVLKM